MTVEKNTRPSAATPRRAAETESASRADTTSHVQYKSETDNGQAGGIASLLMEGRENGLHLSDLVRLTGWTEREVRQMIHQERRQGIPILSNSKDGYYLPGNEYERAECVRQMRGRAREILAAAAGIERGGGHRWDKRD